MISLYPEGVREGVHLHTLTQHSKFSNSERRWRPMGCFAFQARKCSRCQSTVCFHLRINKPPGKAAATGCVFLMPNTSRRLPEGNRLCVNTKPNYSPIVHLEDGESRVLCQLLFLFFRGVGVLKENRTKMNTHARGNI